jgi:hypothetical protein
LKGLLYVETNFIAASATGRDTLTTILLTALNLDASHPGHFRFPIVVPGICFQEALAWLTKETRERRGFGDSIQKQVEQLRRDISGATAPLISLLEQAVVENDDHIAFTSDRLFWAIEKLSKCAEILPITASLLEVSRNEILIPGFTDNLIAHTILDHARSSPIADKGFLTENHKDFRRQEMRAALKAAGIKYFAKTEDALGWAAFFQKKDPTE